MAAADGGIIAGMFLLILILLVINVYILVYYTHPEDKNQSYMAKALVVLGLELATMSILMLPIDIANNMGDPGCDQVRQSTYTTLCGNVNMYTVWQSLFDLMGFVVAVLIPFAIFYYGAEEKEIDDVKVRDPVPLAAPTPPTHLHPCTAALPPPQRRKGCCETQFCRALTVECVVVAFTLVVLLGTYYTSGTHTAF